MDHPISEPAGKFGGTQIFVDLSYQEQVIDYSGGHSGIYNDMIIDPDDKMHITFSVLDYWPNKILGTWYYFLDSDGTNKKWYLIESGEYTAQALARDPFGNIHIAYYDQARGDLKYAKVKYNDSPPPPPPPTEHEGSLPWLMLLLKS